MRAALAMMLVVAGCAPAAAVSEETIGMIVMEAMASSTGDGDASKTGVAFLDTIEKIRHGGKVEMPADSCDTSECTGVYMAIEAVRTARARARAAARR
jgi:hypothetical protein